MSDRASTGPTVISPPWLALIVRPRPDGLVTLEATEHASGVPSRPRVLALPWEEAGRRVGALLEIFEGRARHWQGGDHGGD